MYINSIQKLPLNVKMMPYYITVTSLFKIIHRFRRATSKQTLLLPRQKHYQLASKRQEKQLERTN